MPVRHANAIWEGNLKEGRGEMQFADYSGAFTFASRFEEGEGTNPEELIGGAIAGCFSMALSDDLDAAGSSLFASTATATVEVHPQVGGGFAITEDPSQDAREGSRHRRRPTSSASPTRPRQNCPVAQGAGHTGDARR